MTKLKTVMFLGVFALILIPMEASAWYCEAHSPRANGWGRSDSLNVARRRALRECAVRTPRGYVCRITYCR